MNARQRFTIPFVITGALTIAALVAFGDVRPAGQQETQTPDEIRQEANTWMQSKLRFSQEIFAALTKGDAKTIESNARRMLMINIIEQWKANKPYMDSTEYDAQLNAFEYATKELTRTGKNNNISGALEAYVLLTKSCVKCHQVIRDAEKTR